MLNVKVKYFGPLIEADITLRPLTVFSWRKQCRQLLEPDHQLSRSQSRKALRLWPLSAHQTTLPRRSQKLCGPLSSV